MYLWMQLSFRSRFVVAFDWSVYLNRKSPTQIVCSFRLRLWLVGRDVGRDHVYIPGEVVYVRGESSGKEADAETNEDEEVVITPPLTRALSPRLLEMQNL